MSKTVEITSSEQFNGLLQTNTIVVADFYADWCGPCKMVAPAYENLSMQLSVPGRITFAKVNTDRQPQIAATYTVSVMPTFLVFRNRQVVNKIQGADPTKLSDAVKRLALEAESIAAGGAESSAGASWMGAKLPNAYTDVTREVDVKGVDASNVDGEFGEARGLFADSRPVTLASAGSKDGAAQPTKADWVESDTDDQLMIFIPFQSTLKLHSLQLTSLSSTVTLSDTVPVRPKHIKLFTNRAHTLGFDEAEDTQATQEFDINEKDWDAQTGTATVELRFVKFQNISSLVIFVVSGAAGGERVRIDRLRLIGEAGSKRDQGKLEKISHDS